MSNIPKSSVNRHLRDSRSPSFDSSDDSRGSGKDFGKNDWLREGSGGGGRRRDSDPRRPSSRREDKRQFKVFYEDARRYGGDRHDKRGSGRERDRHGRKERGHARPDLDDPRDHKRRRTRSRSPGGRAEQRRRPGLGYSDRKDERHAKDRRGSDVSNGQGLSRFSRQQPVSAGQQTSPTAPRADGPAADFGLVTTKKASEAIATASQPERFTAPIKHDLGNKMAKEIDAPAPAPAPQDNQGLSIEERRRRREAIKAKYKGQAPPLLIQALQSNASTPSSQADVGTTSRSERSVSPTTPSAALDAGSPDMFNVSNDEDLANQNTPPANADNHDSPLAADYDPSMDMQEDRQKQLVQSAANGVPASAYEETQDTDRVIPVPDSNGDSDASGVKKSGGDDMFASDDEDDMFAPVDPTKETTVRTTKLVPLERAKNLDQTLLDNWDDHEGYYRIILGEIIGSRYQIQANLGKGVFSGVVRAHDMETDQIVAIKIVRANETMTKAGAKEIEILEKLIEADPEDKKHCIRLYRSFMHKGHLCMVFENLSINLREVLKKFGRDVGINHKALKTYARQMFQGLSLLRKCNIIHADIKPDNILASEDRNTIKICDLGSAADAGDNDITPYLVSRFYRAPEIILGIAPEFSIDMWSIGCTLFEMYTGKILFTGRSNNQMLRSIMECRGKFSLKMLKKGEYSGMHFDETQNLNFRSMEKDKLTGKEIVRLLNFAKPTRDLKTRIFAAAPKTRTEEDVKELTLFVDLLDKCLALNPERRLTPSDALKHPFIARSSAVVVEKHAADKFTPIALGSPRVLR